VDEVERVPRTPKGRLADDVVAAIRDSKRIGIRAGAAPHGFVRIWAVVVERRVFVRSWSLRTEGWYGTLLEVPQGTIQVGDREFRVRAVRTRSERLLEAVDQAYLEKYDTPGAIRYARGLGRPPRRATTTELVPL